MTRTDVSDADVKLAVRQPTRESNPLVVAARLAQWDADRAAAVSRGYAIDDHDLRTGLLRLVSTLESFQPVLAALKVAGPFDAARLRAALGAHADLVRSEHPRSGNGTGGKPKSLTTKVARVTGAGDSVCAFAAQLASIARDPKLRCIILA